jgi:hypothetical protein
VNNRDFWRQLRLLVWLRGLYVAIVGLSIGAAVGAILNLFTRGHQ